MHHNFTIGRSSLSSFYLIYNLNFVVPTLALPLTHPVHKGNPLEDPGSPLTGAQASTAVTLPGDCAVLQGRAASVGACGSTGGAQQQTPQPGETTALVSIAVRAGCHTRETAMHCKGTWVRDYPAELPELAPKPTTSPSLQSPG